VTVPGKQFLIPKNIMNLLLLHAGCVNAYAANCCNERNG
jgi:hypothetical protein